jgi:DNA (cytosine-5)-methyltransferase 1
MKNNMIKVGSDFSGVGAFNQALNRLGIEYKEIFACDMDKYARQTFIHNYGQPEYYPTNVYDREIPKDSLDIYMTSPPCQAFSLAGKRLGKEDKRGILFFNSLEFIQVNKPRYFIFENVKGLLSDDGGKTFSEWVNLLGGKTVNGNPILFPYADSVPYHLYWQVLNAKNHGVPQNRERVFLIGIRDDADNNFRFPAEEHLTKRLKDVLESKVDDKYFLSEKMVNCLQNYESDKFQVNTEMINNTDLARSLRTEMAKMGRQDNYIKINSATSKGYEEATDGDSINLEFPESKTRRGRVGKGVAQTLDTGCNQGVMIVKNGRSEEEKKRRKETYKKTGKDSGSFKDKELIIKEQDYSDTILANSNPKKEGLIATEVIQLNQSKESGNKQPYQQNRVYNINGINPALNAGQQTWGGNIINTHQIRRLTPRECFRLMDFPDTFTWPVSDSQAYKQAGNSIVVNVLYKILKNLSL